MYVAPAVSCMYGGTLVELQVTASKDQSVWSVLATACICDAIVYGSELFSKQWLAPKNHGSWVAADVSFRSVPVQRKSEVPSLKTICATALRTLRKGVDVDSVEHLMSTLQEPDVPMSTTSLEKPLATVVKRCDTPVSLRGSERGSSPVGTKNSTVCVSPSVTGDHHGAVRSLMSPTRTGPTRRSGASEPKNTISTLSGTPANAISRRSAPASGEVVVACAAKPPGTSVQARSRPPGSVVALAMGRTTPTARRFWFVPLMRRICASSVTSTGDRRTSATAFGARRSVGVGAASLRVSDGSPGTTGSCAKAAPAPRRSAVAATRINRIEM